MTWKVLVTAPYILPVLDDFADFFAENGIEAIPADVNERMEEEDLLPLIGDIDGVICGDDRFTDKVMDAAPKLKVLAKWGTGIDSLNKEGADKRGITICRTLDAFSEPVADSTMGYILSFARRLPWMDEQMKQGVWDKIPGRALNETTIGVVGVGNCGSAVLRRAGSFGAELLGADIRDIGADRVTALGVDMVSFDELLERSDFVTLHCDLNPASHHLIGRDALEKMKKTAVLLNLSRGPVIDETALIEGLLAGEIAGAALDVFEHEPLPADSPLKRMDNVMLAPHNCNSSPRAWEAVHWSTVKQLLAALKAAS
jgi:phosphoglycerate dehydrogenase-like enzyme